MEEGRIDTSSSDTGSPSELHLQEDDGWEDAEPDREEVKFICLFCVSEFPDMSSMLQHCKIIHDFDLPNVRETFALGFLGVIQLVNYIRREVGRGVQTPLLTLNGISRFDDPQYLVPTLEDDAVLYSLEDCLQIHDEPQHPKTDEPASGGPSIIPSTSRIEELEKELSDLQQRFNNYKEYVDRTLENAWHNSESKEPFSKPRDIPSDCEAQDQGYFTSYSYNDIHETMLKDTVRTDAYRDFIYDNKSLFKGKVVLDVGCGTGILSMFCARAGAAKVIAVDNSDIVDKARENVFLNGLEGVISCLRGRIEEVSLPVAQVDIVISEWMGYCLLYEAMLDSVLWARNHFLAPEGLMVPSHATLHIAPLTDPDFMADHISFWQSVYGFNMTSMLAHIYDEVLVRDVQIANISATSCAFQQLPLHSVPLENLSFREQPFSLEITQDMESFDGFVIWFDAFFVPSRQTLDPSHTGAKKWAKEKGQVAFTTGPDGPSTHWRQGVLLIDYGKDQTHELQKGSIIQGNVGYKKRKENPRELDIEISWMAGVHGKSRRQVWFMR